MLSLTTWTLREKGRWKENCLRAPWKFGKIRPRANFGLGEIHTGVYTKARLVRVASAQMMICVIYILDHESSLDWLPVFCIIAQRWYPFQILHLCIVMKSWIEGGSSANLPHFGPSQAFSYICLHICFVQGRGRCADSKNELPKKSVSRNWFIVKSLTIPQNSEWEYPAHQTYCLDAALTSVSLGAFHS